MLEQMFRASRSVLLNPSVATFEEYEQDHLGWATIYVLTGSVITSLLGLIGSQLQRTSLEQQLADFEDQLGAIPEWLTAIVLPDSLFTSVFSNLISTLIVFFIFLVVIYALGLVVGGNGRFGELAYDVSLFWVPISVISALLSSVAIGPLICVFGPLSFMLWLYNLHLTFISIQSGMNLSISKALIVVFIPTVILLIGLCGFIPILIAGVPSN